jgi:threonylcarbamoyladenosine tRNA methylthiotransferase MtaB
MPDAAIGVDVIVGFPAETESRFENCFEFISDLPVSYLHVFTYSERPDTVAVDELNSMGGLAVEKHVRSRRNRRLRLLSEKKRASFYSRFIGSYRPVLWEDSDKEGLMSGFTDNHIRVESSYDLSRVSRIEPALLGNIAASGNVAAVQSEMDSLPILQDIH